MLDLGTNGPDFVDYPDFGNAVGNAVARGAPKRASSCAARASAFRSPRTGSRGARAALCMNGLMARLARQHNDANILALGARLIGDETARDCLDEFLNTAFEGGRHQRRVDKLSAPQGDHA